LRRAVLQRPLILAQAAEAEPVLVEPPVAEIQPSLDEAKAILRFHRGSPSKVRRVLDAIRGRTYEDALKILTYLPHRCAPMLAAVIAFSHAVLTAVAKNCTKHHSRLRMMSVGRYKYTARSCRTAVRTDLRGGHAQVSTVDQRVKGVNRWQYSMQILVVGLFVRLGEPPGVCFCAGRPMIRAPSSQLHRACTCTQ
jgi:hypothetical protein